jgi:hypothetical protein
MERNRLHRKYTKEKKDILYQLIEKLKKIKNKKKGQQRCNDCLNTENNKTILSK